MIVLKLILDIMETFRKVRGQQGHNLKFTLDIVELIMKRKNKGLRSFNGSFRRNLVGGGFFSFSKGGLWKV